MQTRHYLIILIALAVAGCAGPATPPPQTGLPGGSTSPPDSGPAVTGPVGNLATSRADAQATLHVYYTATALALAATPTPTAATATPVIVISDPAIGDISFLAPLGETGGIPTYPADVQAVDAQIPFSGMAGDLIVRREWLRDGEVWLDVEALWKGQWRGTEGVWEITLDGPLPPGTYELRVYVDEEPLFDAADAASRSFVVEAPADGSLPAQRPPDYRGIRIAAPGGGRAAVVRDWGTIAIQEADGSQRVLVAAHTIGDLAWFPDGQFLVYRDLLPEGETDAFLGYGSQLYVVNVETGTTTRIGRSDERWRNPQVSPDGTMIAVVGGTGFTDACMSDTRIGVIRLDEHKQRRDVLTTSSFTGLAGSDFGITLLPWISATEVQVELAFWCVEDTDVNGIYTLDVVAQTAVQTTPTDPERTPLLGSYIPFTTDPDGDQIDVRSFPAGTARIYALVYYQAMRDGLLFRREWYRNGVLWLVREEPWDFTKYGESGTITDLSIFTDNASLPSGTYELRLYLDGVPQFDLFVGFNGRSFVIEEGP